MVLNSSKWNKVRKRALKRDRNKCKKCGSTLKLHIHHIKQKSIHPKYAYTLSNLITLCQRCHMKLHKRIGFGRHSWSEVKSWVRKHKKVERRNKPIKVKYRPKKQKKIKIKRKKR